MLKEGIGKDIYNTHFRNLSDGRWWSPDPLESKFPDRSTYVSMGNNPISRIDPLGDADYYAKEGNHLGNDGIENNKTMLSTGIIKDKDGNITFENPIDLKVSHQKFLKYSAIVYGESSNSNKLHLSFFFYNILFPY